MSVIDMTSIAGKQANKRESKQARRQTKGGVHEGQMQVWIKCPQLHCVEAWTTHQQARLMHGQVSKCVKVHIKPIGGKKKHGKHIVARSRKGERYARINRHHSDASQVVTPKQGLMGVGSNHITTNPLRASSMVKPKTREASTSIKHRSKRTLTCKLDDPNPLMWALVYGQ